MHARQALSQVSVSGEVRRWDRGARAWVLSAKGGTRGGEGGGIGGSGVQGRRWVGVCAHLGRLGLGHNLRPRMRLGLSRARGGDREGAACGCVSVRTGPAWSSCLFIIVGLVVICGAREARSARQHHGWRQRWPRAWAKVGTNEPLAGVRGRWAGRVGSTGLWGPAFTAAVLTNSSAEGGLLAEALPRQAGAV